MSNNTGSVYATRQAILARSLCNYSPVEQDILQYVHTQFTPGTRKDCVYLEEAYRVFTWEKTCIEYAAFVPRFIDFAEKLHGAKITFECRPGETMPQLCLRGLQFRYAAEYRKMQK